MGILKWLGSFFHSAIEETESNWSKDETQEQKERRIYAERDRLDRLTTLKSELLSKGKGAIELHKNGEIIGFYKNIHKMAVAKGFSKSALYNAYNNNRPYKKIYTIKKCQES